MTKDVASYIVGECEKHEVCVVVIPSHRLGAEDFVSILAQNGVRARPLGKGTGRGVDAAGEPWRVPGVLVLALSKSDLKRFRLYANLHGLDVAKIVSI